MKKSVFALLAIFLSAILAPQAARAHFGLLIPSSSTVTSKDEASLILDVAFSHPFSSRGMNMKKPEQFYVFRDGEKTSLEKSLVEKKFMDHKAWQGKYDISRPGVYQFAIIPQPYFEPAEDSFIIHYVKTCVAAFGAEDDWMLPMGLPVEIVPLTRPFGNYSGNVFQGTVLHEGKPVPGAIVEVENLNKNGRHVAPNEYFETQTVRADSNGNFTFAVPWAGWWGFAALVDSPQKMAKDGVEKDVELGGVIWVEFTAPQLRAPKK